MNEKEINIFEPGTMGLGVIGILCIAMSSISNDFQTSGSLLGLGLFAMGGYTFAFIAYILQIRRKRKIDEVDSK